jgi:hypothetical protein
METIIEWVKAFTVYTAVLLQKHPAQVNELLAYQLTIIKSSQQYDGLQWQAYNTRFTAATGNQSWSELDTDLYTRFLPVGPSQSHCALYVTARSTQQLSAGQKREISKAFPGQPGPAGKKRRRQWSLDICSQYNTGSCSFGQVCKYPHVCGECGGPHAARSCPQTPTK